MIAEYIEREALLKEIEALKKSPWYNDDFYPCFTKGRQDGVSTVVDLCIKKAPAAEVADVMHGEWIRSGPLLECVVCGEMYSQLGGNAGKEWNYCPCCGARMDGVG